MKSHGVKTNIKPPCLTQMPFLYHIRWHFNTLDRYKNILNPVHLSMILQRTTFLKCRTSCLITYMNTASEMKKKTTFFVQIYEDLGAST